MQRWHITVVVVLFLTLLFNLGVFLQDPVNPSDFASYYRAALLVTHGQTAKVYDKNAQLESGGFSGIGYFYHPFFEMPLFLPFTLFSYRISFWLWSVVSALTVALAAWRLDRMLQSPVHPLLSAFAFFPTFILFCTGQDSAWILLLFVLAFVEWEQDRNWRCGIFLALALIKFQYAIPVMALLLIRRRSKYLLAGFSAMTALMVIGSWMVIGTSGMLSYWRILQNHDIQTPQRMMNLRGLVGMFGVHPLAVIGFSLLLLLWLVTRTGISDRQYFCAAITIAVLTSYHGLNYDAVILLIPLLVELSEGEKWVLIFWIEPLYFVLALLGVLALFAIPIGYLAWRLGSVRSRNIRALPGELVQPCPPLQSNPVTGVTR